MQLKPRMNMDESFLKLRKFLPGSLPGQNIDRIMAGQNHENRAASAVYDSVRP